MSKVTHRPMKVIGRTGYGIYDGVTVQDDRGLIVGVAINDVPELEPEKTATLWAAAPDMLAALEFTRAEFDRWAAIRGGMGTYSEAAEKIDAALAKARS